MFKGLFSGGKVMLSFILFSLFRSWGDISAHLMSVSQWYTNKALNWKLSVRLIFKHWLNYVEETTVIAYSSFINRITGYWCYTVDCRQFSADVSRDKISALIKKDLELRSCCSDSCSAFSWIFNPASYWPARKPSKDICHWIKIKYVSWLLRRALLD